MGWILRTSQDLNNPTLPGAVYGKFITIGRAVYWNYDGSQTRGIIFLCDGGKYGIDKLDSFEYNGDPLDEGTEWILHRGTYTKQIEPEDVEDIDTGTNVVTITGHPFTNGQYVRAGASDGSLPAALSSDLKYLISDVTTNTFKVKDEAGSSYIDFADEGSGTVKFWPADAGFDDPDQGLPTFCPEVGTTFNNIAYVEFKLPSGVSSPTEEPEWENFRSIGTGRRLMDYDEDANELGVIDSDDDLLSNPALQMADNGINALKVRPTRFIRPSWKALRDTSAELVWQRPELASDEDPSISGGYTAEYFVNTDGVPHVDRRLTRVDPTLDMSGTSADAPAPGVTSTYWSGRWRGQLLPEFTEVYTLRFDHDDAGYVWINGQLIISNLVAGNDSATYSFEAGVFYDIWVESVQYGGNWKSKLYWSSASQSEEIIPSDRVFPVSTQVKRYESHTAAAIPTEASEIHERLMTRCPGWHWTDDNGFIEFLGPDRPIKFAFSFDKVDDDNPGNLVKGQFNTKRRPISDRRNFLLFRFRDVEQTGFPFAFTQADRDDLRRFTNGEPTNDPATDVGVSTRSLTQRIGEMEMVLKSDPDHLGSISGGRSSGVIRKNDLISVSYYDENGNFVADDIYLVIFHSWGSSQGRNDFNLVPITLPFYTDEPVT